MNFIAPDGEKLREATEWDLRCDLAASFRLSWRFRMNVGIGNHFSLMIPGHDDRLLVKDRKSVV